MPLSVWVLLIVLLVAIASIPSFFASPARSAFCFRAAKRNYLSVAATGWSQDLYFSHNSSDRNRCFQAVVRFFYPCNFCGA